MASPVPRLRRIWQARPELIIALALYAAAFAVRIPFASTPPYGDDAVHYTFATTLWHRTSNLYDIYAGQGVDFSPFFWQRPVFYLLLAPFAEVSFVAFRTGMILASSAVPALVFLVLYQATQRVWLNAALAGSLVAFPALVTYGVRAFPDQIAAVFLLAALLARHRPWMQAAILVAAAWTKEVAIVAIAALWVWHGVQVLRRRPFSWRTESKHALPLAVATLAAPLALLYSQTMGIQFPGWSTGGGPLLAVDVMSGSIWFLPLVLAAGVLRPGHAAPYIAAGIVLFFAVYSMTSGLMAQSWYVGLSLPFVVIAAGLTIHAFRNQRRLRTSGTVLATVFIAALLVMSAASADSIVRNTLNPYRNPGPNLLETTERLNQETLHVVSLQDHVAAQEPERIVALDVEWFYLDYPLGRHANRVDFAYTIFMVAASSDVNELILLANKPGALLVVGPWAAQLDVQTEVFDAFAECEIAQFGPYRVVKSGGCAEIAAAG